MRACGLGALAVLSIASLAHAQTMYREPPGVIEEILDSDPLPDVSVGPDRKWLVLAHRKSMLPLEELAVPTITLSRRQVNPRTNSSRDPFADDASGFTLVRVADGKEWELGVPHEHLSLPVWSQAGRYFIFRHTGLKGVELWLVDVTTREPRMLVGPFLNAAHSPTGVPCVWMSDSSRMLCELVPDNRGAAPSRPETPDGVVVEENEGAKAPVRIYGGMLKDSYDEALYDYYMTSQPVVIDAQNGATKPIGEPGIYESLSPSPDGEYFLVVQIVRPYSHSNLDFAFPKVVQIWDKEGHCLQTVARLPADNSGFSLAGWAPKGPRRLTWQPTQPATFIYTEALDGGDPGVKARFRDRLMALSAPFTGKPRELIRTESRLSPYPIATRWYSPHGNLGWLHNGLAWVEEFNYGTHYKKVWLVNTESPSQRPTKLFEFNTDEPNANPGSPLINAPGREEPTLTQEGDWVFLGGGTERPFLDSFNLRTHQRKHVFSASGQSFEEAVAVLDTDARTLLTRYETPTKPPEYLIRDLKARKRRAITSSSAPLRALAGVRIQPIQYQRADGVPLSAELYLPATYSPGHPVPAIIWGYPKEYISSEGASHTASSPYRFPWTDSRPLFLLVRLMATQGYAVMWNAAMPVVGGARANDTAVEQLTADAAAAVAKLMAMGVTYPGGVGIAGHSYGAVMAATLVAHSDLFAAAAAIDGAYNLTLDPFGFQNETRSLWDVPSVYMQLSALLSANRIRAPLLLIHGDLDSSSATRPMEAQSMYEALKGLGRKVRFVRLPYEQHVPEARESNLHVAWELVTWFDRYLKSRPISPGAQIAKTGAESGQ